MSDGTAARPAPSRVLTVTAHPDDVDFGAAGSVAVWTAAGVEVAYLVVTNGAAGGFDRSIGRDEIVAVREAEQQAAAHLVGVEEVTFLGYEDGALVADLDLRKAITREIRRFRPDVVVTQSPERNYERMPASHPDHLAAGEATICAVYPDARNPFAHRELLEEEGLEPHAVGEVWLAAHPVADHAVDVSEVIDAKVAAILAHASQLPDPSRVERFVRQWTGEQAERFGLGPGRHAEAFKVIRIA